MRPLLGVRSSRLARLTSPIGLIGQSISEHCLQRLVPRMPSFAPQDSKLRVPQMIKSRITLLVWWGDPESIAILLEQTSPQADIEAIFRMVRPAENMACLAR